MSQGPRPTECILWQGGRGPKGYGTTRFDGVVTGAHRAAYCKYHNLVLSDIAGQVVRHSCDNPPCVNPEHLSLGSYADNSSDMLQRERQARGTGNGRHVLLPEQVLAIRESSSTQTALAKQYGVARSTIQRVLNRTLWAHI